MRAPRPLSLYCISLLCFQLLTAEELFSSDHPDKPTDPKEAPPSVPGAPSAAASVQWPLVALGRPARARRHARHYPQLMRVGCVLGTCQVQNLSHRLYQLIGRSGREDSSPINPKSPHSYG